MTREEAVAAAREFVVREGRRVTLEPEMVLRMEAERFNRLLGAQRYPSDFWVVHFRKILPPDVAFESPSTVAVEVIDATGEVRPVRSP